MLLLPTQEMLVQRLQHMASYSEQLLVVCGEEGSGKSTLIATLASELDEVNSALVLCPRHADSSEIRRKIWIQLVSDPIFDDELPLTDTLLRIQPHLTKPLHIIIDDAHLLPKVLWAECILLSQIAAAGHKVSVTFTIDNKFWLPLIAELTEPMRALLLQVIIDPLPMAEREALYQTLLLRSEQSSFTPRSIVSNLLEKQSGKPSEVVTLLVKALETQTETKNWRRFLPKLISFTTILAGLGAWWLFTTPNLWQDKIDLRFKPDILASQVNSIQGKWLENHGNTLLMQYWWTRQTPGNKHSAPSLQLALIPEPKKPLQSTASSQPSKAKVKAADANNKANSQASTDSLRLNDKTSIPLPKLTAVHVNHTRVTPKLSEPKTQPASINMPQINHHSGAVVPETLSTHKAPFINGYTLQLASVSQKASLKPIFNKIPRGDRIYTASSNGNGAKSHLVFLGAFDTESQARAKAAELSRLGFAEPWLRKWRDLQQYSFD
jgi:DamX protein